MSSMLPMLKNHLQDPLTMDLWDTLNEFHHHHHHREAMHPPLSTNTVEWSETPEAHLLRAELPGYKKEEVRVKVKEGNFLKISGKKKVEREEKHDSWHHFERKKGKFSRVFSLPENSRADRVKSCFDNGRLTVTVPKRDVKRSHFARNVEVN